MTVRKTKVKGKDAIVADLPGGGKKVWTEDGKIHVLGPAIPKTSHVVRPLRDKAKPS